MIRTALFSAALAIATFAGAAVTHAQPADAYGAQLVSASVRTDDLNPATSAGAQRLAFRIRIAAQSVCGGELRNVRTGAGFDACVRDTLAATASKLNDPMVSAALGVSATSAYARR